MDPEPIPGTPCVRPEYTLDGTQCTSCGFTRTFIHLEQFSVPNPTTGMVCRRWRETWELGGNPQEHRKKLHIDRGCVEGTLLQSCNNFCTYYVWYLNDRMVCFLHLYNDFFLIAIPFTGSRRLNKQQNSSFGYKLALESALSNMDIQWTHSFWGFISPRPFHWHLILPGTFIWA